MKIIAISNPISGNKNIENIREELISRFSNHDFELWKTEFPKHAIDLAKKAASQNADIIIAIGGDGTVIEVISGMADSNSKLAIIPFGTGNMLAGNLGIPINISRAIDIIFEGYSQKIDIGKIGDAYFAFMAGCGFDAKIIEEVSREKKRKFGLLAYFIEGFKQVFRTRNASFKIILDNKKIIKTRALTILVANSGNIIGNMVSLAPHASFCDGLLDIIIISPKGFWDYVSILWKILKKQTSEKLGRIQHYQAREIEIKSKPSLLVQADGDIIGKTPVKVEAIPGYIEVLSPKIPCENQLKYFADDHIKRILSYAFNNIRIYPF